MKSNAQGEFANYKACTVCGKPLPLSYEKAFCPSCEDEALFKEVREYIRSHNVTEFELADVFGIPQSKVRKWIREGRIEYVSDEKKMMNTRCSRCGVPVTFGALCPNCMRIMNGSKEISYTSFGNAKNDKNKMRFLSNDND